MATVELKIVLICATVLMLSSQSGALPEELALLKIEFRSSQLRKPEDRFTEELTYAAVRVLSQSEDQTNKSFRESSGKVRLTQPQNDDQSSRKSEKAITSTARRDSLLILAQKLAYSREFDRAESILEMILSDDPDNTAALYQLAVVLSWDGKYNQSIQVHDKLYKLQPENHGLLLETAKVRLWKADREYDSNSYRDAAKLLERYLELNPSNAIALKRLGYAYLRYGRLSQANQILSSALEKDPQDIESEYLFAQTLAHQGEFEEGRHHFEAILDKHPLANEVRLSYADLLSWMSLHQEAAKQYLLILNSDPYNPGALIGLGRLKSWEGDFGSAEAYYNSALSRNPNAEGPLLEMANLKMWQNQRKRAIEYFRKVLRINPNNTLSKMALEELSWSRSSMITFLSGYFEDTRAYSRYWVGGDITVNLSDHIAFDLLYLNWTFSEPETPTLYRHDATISFQCRPGPWLEAGVGFTSSIFSHQEDSIFFRWASSLAISPVRILKLYFSYSKIPYTENLAVVKGNYFFDRGGVGLDWQLTRRLSIQLEANRAWFNGTHSLGYYDCGIDKWVTLGSYQDRTRREELTVQASSRILNKPRVDLKHKYSKVEYRTSQDVPYWAPSSLSQHTTTIGAGYTIRSRLELSMECRGIYTNGEKELGFGISGLLRYRLKKVLQTEVSVYYDHVHIDLPWEGLGGVFTLSLRL